jgi:hypothetical protein
MSSVCLGANDGPVGGASGKRSDAGSLNTPRGKTQKEERSSPQEFLSVLFAADDRGRTSDIPFDLRDDSAVRYFRTPSALRSFNSSLAGLEYDIVIIKKGLYAHSWPHCCSIQHNAFIFQLDRNFFHSTRLQFAQK